MKRTLRTVCAAAITITLGTGIAAALSAARADESNSPKASLADDPDWKAGKKASDAQDWKSAVASFSRAARKFNDADAYNMLAHSQREAGDLDAAFKNYNLALRLDPAHRAAHEYIGEAFLVKGDLASAEKHLQALDRLCNKSCEEYEDLDKAITEFKSKKR